MKFVIFKKNKYFQKLSFKKQAEIIDNILKNYLAVILKGYTIVL